MCLLFQMSCGEQLKRLNGKTSFVDRLNNSRCVESGHKTLDLPKSGPGFLPEVVVIVCINTADCFWKAKCIIVFQLLSSNILV